MKGFLRKLERAFDAFANILGVLSIVFLALLVIVVFYNVVARYLFPAANSVAMQELTWWLYSAMFLFGVTYALKKIPTFAWIFFTKNLVPLQKRS